MKTINTAIARDFTRVVVSVLGLAVMLSGLVRVAQADPCGMVPPVYQGDGPPIVRIGLQKTYVFHKDGVETFVIRPGFSGKVDQFGMLIPFPAVPSLRKVPDDIFGHIANAIDPPEVVIDVRRRLMKLSAMPRGASSAAEGDESEMSVLRRDEVRVLKQEAVGMYEVAVLAAGSADALKKWMDHNGFRYPDGMEDVTEEYIAEKWCFVAVKTKVAEKSGVDPKPGQKDVDDDMDDRASFDGFVQAMGFRFRTEEMVVPMRLSTFNGGDLRNVVYVLTDSPQRIAKIDSKYVVRQISGEQLIKNVSDPLPLRIIGGTEKDIAEWQRANLTKRRDPTPKNGFAKNLFASDMLAVASGELNLRHEESEKALLRIGEFLSLRGASIDKLNAEELSKQIDKTNRVALQELAGMTLSVIDGDFPRELLADENLKFATFEMPENLNSQLKYDATRFGPGQPKSGTLIETGSIRNRANTYVYAAIGTFPLLVFIGVACSFRCGIRRLLVLVSVTSVLASGTIAMADHAVPAAIAEKSVDAVALEPVSNLLNTTGSEVDPGEAIATLVGVAESSKETRRRILQDLNSIAAGKADALATYDWAESPADENLVRRGWAIAAMSQLEGLDSDGMLLEIHSSESQPMLVRTWAAAARVEMVDTTAALVERAALIQKFPSLERPIGKRLLDRMQSGGERVSVEQLISLSNRTPQLERALASPIMSVGAAELARTMTTAGDDAIRRKAAAYLGTLASSDPAGVAEAVADVYMIDPMEKKVPWDGGALYVPGIQWTRESGTPLVENLIAWNVWCEENGQVNQQRQILNNLRSVSLSRSVGYQSPGSHDAIGWLKSWSKVVGKNGIIEMLETLNVSEREKYRTLISSL